MGRFVLVSLLLACWAGCSRRDDSVEGRTADGRFITCLNAGYPSSADNGRLLAEITELTGVPSHPSLVESISHEPPEGWYIEYNAYRKSYRWHSPKDGPQEAGPGVGLLCDAVDLAWLRFDEIRQDCWTRVEFPARD